MTEKLDSYTNTVEKNGCISRDQIEQLIAGNHTAFQAIYGVYSSKVFRVAFKYLKDTALSQEIVQETFIKLWLTRHNIQIEGDIWSYLSLIAKRLSLNSLRDILKSTSLNSELLADIDDTHNTTEENLYARDLEQITDKLIKNLPKQQQLIYQLSRTEGLSHKEIAEQLHISPSTVNNHLVQALKTLRSNLEYSYLHHLILIFFLLRK